MALRHISTMQTTTLPKDLMRTSACPVHFLWDGVGMGRWPVRLAFWLFCAVGVAFSGARAFHLPVPQDALAVATMALGALWTVGQVLGMAARWRARQRV